METSNEKQVTIKKENLPSDILFEADAAQGLENVRTENLALPITRQSKICGVTALWRAVAMAMEVRKVLVKEA